MRLARVIFDEEPNIPEGLDIKDPTEVLNYLLGRNYGIVGEDQSGVPQPERKTEAVKEQVEKDQSEKPEKETEDKKNINNQGE